MTGEPPFIKNDIPSIAFTYLERATEIRKQANITNNGEYIPPLFEIAFALQELGQNNTEVNSQSWVMQWLRDRLDIQNPDNNVNIYQATDINQTANIAQSDVNYDISTSTVNDQMQRMYNELQALNLNGAKIELVKKPPMGI